MTLFINKRNSPQRIRDMTKFQPLIQSFLHRGFLSLKKIIDYAFPNQQQEGPKITDKVWVRVFAGLAPFVTMALLFWIYSHPPLFSVLFPMAGQVFYYAAFGYAAFYALFLLFSSLILFLKRRNPSVLLILSPIAPIKGVAMIFASNLLFFLLGFDQAAQRLADSDRQLAAIEQNIKEEKLAMRNRREQAEIAFRQHFKQAKEDRQKTSRQFQEQFDASAQSFREAFAKEWDERMIQREKTQEEQDRKMREASEEWTKGLSNRFEEFQKQMGFAGITEEQRNAALEKIKE